MISTVSYEGELGGSGTRQTTGRSAFEHIQSESGLFAEAPEPWAASFT